MAKKVKKIPAIGGSAKSYQTFIRYSNFAFFILISILLAIASVLLVLMIANQNGTAQQPTETISASFDTNTIEKINALSETNKSASQDFPSGRINPFVEQ